MTLHMTECTDRERVLFADAVDCRIDALAAQARELRYRAMGPGVTDPDADSMNRSATQALNLLDEYAALKELCPGLSKAGEFGPRPAAIEGETD